MRKIYLVIFLVEHLVVGLAAVTFAGVESIMEVGQPQLGG
jgi:hypothetical protein